MELKKLGEQLREKRLSKKISLNRMSNDLYGYRYRVNHLSNIENGRVDISFTQLIKICNYLKIRNLSLKKSLKTVKKQRMGTVEPIYKSKNEIDSHAFIRGAINKYRKSNVNKEQLFNYILKQLDK